MDWYNPDKHNNHMKSFGYILPLDSYTLLVEETLLSTNKQRNHFNKLKNRLFKRIKAYNFKDFNIVNKEIYSIPLNKPIQTKYSLSFGIGQGGNMINIISGYTIGYNIYHIPEYCDSIINSDFKLDTVVNSYWNFKRIIINKINLLGLNFMENLTQEELSEFLSYYFKYIFGSYNYKIFFLNCDNKKNFSWIKMIYSFYNYIYFPKKFLFKIAKSLFGY